jgi:hypothetical protein
MPTPALRSDYFDVTTPGSNAISAAQYNLNAQRTDAAYDASRLYTHTQSSAAATWTITHTLGRKPSSVTVWVLDEHVITDISSPNTTTVVITFPSPTSGRAELS